MHRESYEVESYWTAVAKRIARRSNGGGFIAGDDTPYFRYRRERFLRNFLRTTDFAGKDVLEVGCGPGGNLQNIVPMRPGRLVGVDISEAMLDLAKKAVPTAELHKIDGATLPFPDRSFDVTLTVTVLQHNPAPDDVRKLIGDICRVSRESVVLVEETAPRTHQGFSTTRRPVTEYEAMCGMHGFHLCAAESLNTAATLFMHRLLFYGWKLSLGRSWHEGDGLPPLLAMAMRTAHALTRPMDGLLPERAGLKKMTFARTAQN